MTDDPGPGSTAVMLPRVGKAVVVAASSSVVVGLLSYFGWAYTAAQARTWGIDATYFQLSKADYVLRSVNAVYVPLAFAIGAALVVVTLWRRYQPWLLRHDRRIAALARWLQRAGGATLVGGGVALSGLSMDTSKVPGVCLTLGALLLLGGLYVASLRRLDAGRVPLHLVGLAVAIGVVGVFSFTRVYAGDLGEERARSLANHASRLADVLVYSTEPLSLLSVIDGQRPVVDRFGDVPIYRYRCLNVLARVGDTLLLIPFGYSTDLRRSVVYAVDATKVRLDFDGRRVQHPDPSKRGQVCS